MLVIAITLALLGATVSYPQHSNPSHAPISQKDRLFLRTLPSHSGSYPAGFKVFYMDRDGVLARKPEGECLKVVGSPKASHAAALQIAKYLSRMLKNAPPFVFSTMARKGAGIGVFDHAHEKVTMFPEYAKLADRPECKGTCKGACKDTCTFDGRKYDSLAGTGGILSVVEVANVLCTASDPYFKKDNIAVHEFSHLIDFYGFDLKMTEMKKAAYTNAKAKKLWKPDAYSMSNNEEYFAEATGAFFMVNRQDSPGGMNQCGKKGEYCQTEMKAREHLRTKDPLLYKLLVYVYTNKRPALPSGLTICP